MFIKLLLVLLLLSISVFLFLSYQKQTPVIKQLTVKDQNLSASITNTKNPEFIAIAPLIDKIFAEDHSWTNAIPLDRKRVLIATGDVILARVVNIQATKFRNFKWPFEKTANVLKNADIIFINLETPLIKNCPLVNDGMKFCGDERNIEGLEFAGVDIANLANNHASNYGTQAIASTIDLLNRSAILATGIDGPIYKNVQGLNFAFLGYNDISKIQQGVSNVEEDKMQKEIAKAKQNADVVVVALHWGVEYKDQPDERQKYLGRFAIDAGADLIVGNHPHWIQPVEIYKGKIITYAHGNFIFDQEWSQQTKEGVVGRYIFFDNQLVDVEYLPIQIDNYGQPYFLEGIRKKSILEKMQKKSIKLNQ